MNYLAHTKDGKTFVDENSGQSVIDHLKNTAQYTKKFTQNFNSSEIGELLGLLHDYGKYSDGFQAYIRGAKQKSPHSIIGALQLCKMLGKEGEFLSMPISGHHSGLNNFGNKNALSSHKYFLENSVAPNISQNELSINEIKTNNLIDRSKFQGDYKQYALSVWIKMLFSCLVDADRIDTEEFCTDIKRKTLSLDYNILEEKLDNFIPKSNGEKLNILRNKILQSCISAAEKPQGLFTLTVPTGGGKTLSSLAFAIKHAKKHSLKRIIYVIPYTSIIEQNAQVFKACLGEEFVLEHHSNIITDYEKDFKAKWAAENWDIPIVVTTNVQFFESYYSNKPSSCRKLHNLSESVIIFDEAQNIPINYFSPCIYSICELVTNYNSTAVLCSATQPVIDKYKYKNLQATEIAENPTALAEALKRVEYEFIGRKTDEEILQEIQKYTSALIIVNTRKHAFLLYEQLKKLHCNVCHLSTLITPLDRRKALEMVKSNLKNSKPVILISTSLIEAGVDIDFPVVLRAISGMDSIIQAGGRANREGKQAMGRVLVFEPTDAPAPKSQRNQINFTKEVIEVLGNDAFGLQGIKKYFTLLNAYAENSKEKIDSNNIIGDHSSFEYKTVSCNFKLIEQNTHSIVIQSEANKSLIARVRKGEISSNLLRELGQYTVNIYKTEYDFLKSQNVIEDYNGVLIMNTANFYSPTTGLKVFTQENLNAEFFEI